LNYTIKSLRPYFNTWEEVIYHYNYERMHDSLSDGDNIVVPYEAYVKKKKVLK
jgi:putative transposase